MSQQEKIMLLLQEAHRILGNDDCGDEFDDSDIMQEIWRERAVGLAKMVINTLSKEN